MPYAIVEPVLDESVRELCTKPYPRHPKGCPNFGQRKTCPPAAPLYWDVYDLIRSVVTVWNVFDLEAHVAKMRAEHPGWSRAQLECCRYWQGTARKQLGLEMNAALGCMVNQGDVRAERCPEAMGVNVTATMASIEVHLEWPPVTKAVQVALLAYLRSS